MVLKHGRTLAAVGMAVLAWSGLAAAQQYRPGEFLKLDLSKAVLSPKPLGPATSFTPGPLDVTVDRANSAVQANAELLDDPKSVPAATVHVDNVPATKEPVVKEPATRKTLRTASSGLRVARAPTERSARHRPRTLVALHGRNPMEAQARATSIQVWPCKSGGICDWKR
jgi:hypothetical protein